MFKQASVRGFELLLLLKNKKNIEHSCAWQRDATAKSLSTGVAFTNRTVREQKCSVQNRHLIIFIQKLLFLFFSGALESASLGTSSWHVQCYDNILLSAIIVFWQWPRAGGHRVLRKPGVCVCVCVKRLIKKKQKEVVALTRDFVYGTVPLESLLSKCSDVGRPTSYNRAGSVIFGLVFQSHQQVWSTPRRS